MKENIIRINLKNKEDYRNEFNSSKLSSSLSDYILEEAKSINIKQKIKFIIKTDFEMTELEKEELVTMIRNNFGTDVGELHALSKNENLMNLGMLLVGFIIIILYLFLLKEKLISELASIIGCVFIWEAICNLLFKGVENKLKIIRRKQIIRGKIIFE